MCGYIRDDNKYSLNIHRCCSIAFTNYSVLIFMPFLSKGQLICMPSHRLVFLLQIPKWWDDGCVSEDFISRIVTVSLSVAGSLKWHLTELLINIFLIIPCVFWIPGTCFVFVFFSLLHFFLLPCLALLDMCSCIVHMAVLFRITWKRWEDHSVSNMLAEQVEES